LILVKPVEEAVQTTVKAAWRKLSTNAPLLLHKPRVKRVTARAIIAKYHFASVEKSADNDPESRRRKCREKLIEHSSIKTIKMSSISGLLKKAIPVDCVENPPVEVVVIAWLIASKKLIPAK